MRFLEDWFPVDHDVEKTIKEAENVFSRWYKANIIIKHGYGKNVEEIFGFPYTSSSEWAGIWNCNAVATLKADSDWSFKGLLISEEHEVIALFHNNESEEKFITIGGI